MTWIELAPTRHDGWRIIQNGWHYFLGQPAGKATDGWVGFGGRQGAHWFTSRLVRVGYLHYPTRAWDDVGGAPTYTRPGRLSRTPVTRTIGPNADTQVLSSTAQWTGIWATPGGGDVTLRWRVNARQLKEEIVVNAAARNWIAANHPPETPANETYFGFVFQLDLSDIPRVVKNGLLQDIEGDFDDSDGRLQLEDALQRLLAFMPLDYAYVNTTIDIGTGTPRPIRRWIPLRKRIYKDGDDYFLLVGARVDQLATLPSGDIVFDPTFIVAETNEDACSEGTDEFVQPSQGSVGVVSLGWYQVGVPRVAVDGGWIFRSTGIGSGDTIDTATLNLEYAGANQNLPLVGALQAYDVDTPTDFVATDVHRLSAHHALTTASVAANIPTGADYTSASLVTVVQEVVDRAGFAGDIGIVWVSGGSGGTSEFWDWTDYTTSTTLATELTITFTPAGGGTEYNQNVSGAMTPSAALVKSETKVLAGSSTPAGALLRAATKALTGSNTPAGTLINAISRALSGGISPSGALATFKTTFQSLTASITPSGTLTHTANKVIAGTLSSAGAINRAITHVLSGTITPDAALATTLSFFKSLTASLTPASTLNRVTTSILAGSITPSADLTRLINRVLSGALTSAGSLTASRLFNAVLTGAITPAGVLLRSTQKSLDGTVSPIGSVAKAIARALSALLAMAGTLIGNSSAVTGTPSTAEPFTFNLFIEPLELDAAESLMLLHMPEPMALNLFIDPMTLDTEVDPLILRLAA
jgi:hypothetical protein